MKLSRRSFMKANAVAAAAAAAGLSVPGVARAVVFQGQVEALVASGFNLINDVLDAKVTKYILVSHFI